MEIVKTTVHMVEILEGTLTEPFVEPNWTFEKFQTISVVPVD